MIKTEEVPDLMRQHTLNVELVGLSARRILKRGVEDDVRLSKLWLAVGVGAEIRNRQCNGRGRSRQGCFVGERNQIDTITSRGACRTFAAIAEADISRGNRLPS